LLGPSDTARIVVVDANAARCAVRVEQLSWRGFVVTAGSVSDLGGAHAAVVVLDSASPEDLDLALRARDDGLVLVLCGVLDAAALQRALHAGVTAWADADASVPVLTEHLYRGLDAVRAQTLGETAIAALQELPVPVVVADASGRVLVASRAVDGAHPGQDALGVAAAPGWRDHSLAAGARLHVLPSAGGAGSGDASVRLAQVAAFAGEAQHEVNNFATYVLANLGALLDEEWSIPPSKEDQLEMTREAHEGARGMVDVVRRLRAAVQAEAAPQLGPVDLSAVIRDAAATMGAGVSIDAPPSLPARADAPRLSRAVALLLWAAREKGDGDAVQASLSVERGGAVLRISGGGPGFDRVGGRKLFSSFLKEPGQAAPPADSLSLVTAIASEHGGGAMVREHPDGRRWFVLELPLDESAPL
jgi:signal transduction histidine kinase